MEAEGPEATQYLLAVARALKPWEESDDLRMDCSCTGNSQCSLTAALLPPKGFLVSDAVLSDALAAVLSVGRPGVR